MGLGSSPVQEGADEGEAGASAAGTARRKITAIRVAQSGITTNLEQSSPSNDDLAEELRPGAEQDCQSRVPLSLP